MNNIELDKLKKDIKKYFGYDEEQIENVGYISDIKLNAIKRDIEKIDNRLSNSTCDKHFRNNIERRINKIFKEDPHLKDKRLISDEEINKKFNENKVKILENNKKKIIETHKQAEKPKIKQAEKPKKEPTPEPKIHRKPKTVKVTGRKPKILFISDVKGWAWWIKSHYLKKYLDEYFDIDVICLLGPGSIPYNMVNQKKYDLYFTFGFSYIDFLYKVPMHKKITGVTAHRRRNVIEPKMKMAGWHHANSIMLLKEMHDMGFKRCFYVPNGVDENLFKPINPIRRTEKLVVGHVGKECPAKGQKECIFPAISTTGVKSYTNTKNWKNKIPHEDMPNVYNQFDVFLISSLEDGTPNPGLESAACGRPVISNHIGNMPEMITDGYNGFLVSKNVGSYVNKINYFKKNRDELIEMGLNARKEIEEKWTWQLMSKNYLRMFDTIFDIHRNEDIYVNPSMKHLEKL